MTASESFTFNELDELVGASLYMGRVHNAIANLLDVTHDREDAGLIELLNHAPVSLVMEILPTTVMVLQEAKARIDGLLIATGAATDSAADRVVAERAHEPVDDEFNNIIWVEFARDRKKNGG